MGLLESLSTEERLPGEQQRRQEGGKGPPVNPVEQLCQCKSEHAEQEVTDKEVADASNGHLPNHSDWLGPQLVGHVQRHESDVHGVIGHRRGNDSNQLHRDTGVQRSHRVERSAGSDHGQGNLGSVEESNVEGDFPSELTWVRCSQESNQPSNARWIQDGDGNHHGESHADG